MNPFEKLANDKTNYKTYTFHYQHKGSTWGIDIKAENREDAEQRMQMMQFATFVGELVFEIPANKYTWRLFPPIVALLNFFRVRRKD